MSQTEAMARAFSRGENSSDVLDESRSELFRRIQKRDGAIVDFEKGKIADAIFKAAQSVGGKDRRLSEMLADRVILQLRNDFEGNLLNIEDVQDAVEKVLIENGHARTVKAYILYRDNRSRIRQLHKGALDAADLRGPDQAESGHADVEVETSSDRVVRWDRERIVNALIRETGLARKVASRIASDIEKQIVYAKIHRVTAALIRELVNAKLVEYGLEEERRLHTRLGLPRYDVERLLLSADPAHRAGTPAESEAWLAAAMEKQFAATRIFSQEIVEGHLSGILHVDGLERISRLESFLFSPEYTKKFGALDAPGTAGASRSLHELIESLVDTVASLADHASGRVGLDAVNVLLAPSLAGHGPNEIQSAADLLIRRLASEARRPRGIALRVDLHLFWNVPRRLRDVPATDAGGAPCGEDYGYYEIEARNLALALVRACHNQSRPGIPVAGVRLVAHLDEEYFHSSGAEEFLEVCAATLKQCGSPIFAFDRDGSVRLSPYGIWNATGQDALAWKVRGGVGQTVTLNLPRLAYQADGSSNRLFDGLIDALNLAMKAHTARRGFIDRLLAAGEEGPYRAALIKRDGEPFLRPSRLRFAVGVVGLAEMAEAHLGQSFHDSTEPLKFVLEVLARIHLECKRLGARDGVSYVVANAPDARIATRLAGLDLESFAGSISARVTHNSMGGYSLGLPSDHGDDAPLARCKREGKFHKVLEGAAGTELPLSGDPISATALSELISGVAQKTRNVQLTLSPTWTVCRDCEAVDSGMRPVCPTCHSSRVSRVVRSNGHYRALDPGELFVPAEGSAVRLEAAGAQA